jgi:selenocysteine-specific elongation factor
VALAEDVVASFVDVPGHERFVRNMLAGAHGIDAVLLVVAADESVMPQTREHFEICRLLGIARGVVALTKCDLADSDLQAAAELETRELVAGSFLEGQPLVRVSAVTGEGLPELRAALLGLARGTPSRPWQGLLRLPVDRVFSMKGFGTVVTGTLTDGELAAGEELEILPAGGRARVRGLQVHGEAVARAQAGTRTAVNLAGVELDGVARGQVLVRPGTMRPSSMLDVEISLLPGARPLRDGGRVRVHAASAEVLGRVALLGRRSLEPGASSAAQLRLETAVVAGRGDRLVLRSYSPAETIAGASVLDPSPPRRTGADRAAVERLRGIPTGAAAELFVAEAGTGGLTAASLAARLAVPGETLLGELRERAGIAVLGPDASVLVSRGVLDSLGQRTLAALAAFHGERPLLPGMPREELRERVFAGTPAVVFDQVLSELGASGKARALPDVVALAGHEVRLSAGEEQARSLLVDTALAAGLAGVEVASLARAAALEPKLLERVGRVLVTQRVLGRVGDSLLVHREHLEALKQDVRRRWPTGSKLDVSAFKELTGLSRKYVIPLLEYLDRERLTRRVGNDRVVL